MTFPIIRHIDDVLPWIKDKPEFVVSDKGDYKVINYHITTDTSFDNPFARECRGIKFDREGKIIARPFQKFFNINQVPETQEDIIDYRFNENHLIMMKRDGSMVHPLQINDGIRLCTKMGITDTSLQAEEFIKNKKNYYGLFRDWIESGCTPIFEWTSNQQRIVLDYPNDQLTLLAIRSNISGEYMRYELLQNIGRIYDIPVVESFPSANNVFDLVKQIKSLEGEEGIVVRFEDGEMLKVKSDWYCLRHSSRDIIGQEYKVIQLILKEEVDDLKPMLFGDDIKKVEELEILVEKIIKFITRRNDLYFSDVQKFSSRKDFAVSTFASSLNSTTKSAMFSMMDGKNSRELAIKEVLKNCEQDSVWKLYKEIYTKIFV